MYDAKQTTDLLDNIAFVDGNAAHTSAHTKNDSLMSELHKTILNRDIYLSQKENHLNKLRNALAAASDDSARFYALGDLLDEFRPYNTDSAFEYCRQRESWHSRQATLSSLQMPGSTQQTFSAA